MEGHTEISQFGFVCFTGRIVGYKGDNGWFVNKITIYGHNKGELGVGVELHHCLCAMLLASRVGLKGRRE
jgi:hypothetical protein